MLMQKLSDENIYEKIEELNIKENEKEFLRNNHIIFEKYLQSDLFKEIKEAKEVHKEEAFYMDINYSDTNEKILTQGVIDLYFVNKNDELILVDYKTDKNVDENILKERYQTQLDLYKVALSRALHRDANRIYIYSTYLNKAIRI